MPETKSEIRYLLTPGDLDPDKIKTFCSQQEAFAAGEIIGEGSEVTDLAAKYGEPESWELVNESWAITLVNGFVSFDYLEGLVEDLEDEDLEDSEIGRRFRRLLNLSPINFSPISLDR